MPGTTVSPGGRAASATDQPAVVSWSVSAMTLRPAARAVASSSAGVSVLSDTEEWVCRSIRIRTQPAARSLTARRQARDRLGVVAVALVARPAWGRRRLGGALVIASRRGATPVAAEQQAADPAVEDIRVGQEGDLRQRLLLTGGLEPKGSVPEQLTGHGLLPRQVGDAPQRQQGHRPRDDAGGEQHPPGADDEVPHPPLGEPQAVVDERPEDHEEACGAADPVVGVEDQQPATGEEE